MKKFTFLTLFLLVLNFFSPLAPTHAARPGLWETSSIKNWLEGEFDNTGLTSEGKLIPTLSTDEVQLSARLAWKAQTLEDRIIVGTSLPSSIYEITSDGETRQLIQTKDLGFTAMAKFNGGVYIANTPTGDIYRYDSDDTKPIKVTTLPDSYIWTMQVDPRNEGIYIGSGPRGNLYHLNENHEIKKIDQVPGNNIMSMTVFDGTLFVGDDQGGVFRLKHESSIASSLGLTAEKTILKSFYGFANGEVSALAGDDNYLYMAVNHQRKSPQQQTEDKKTSDLAKQLRQKALRQRATAPRMGPLKKQQSDTPRKPRRIDESNILLQAIRNKTQQQGIDLFSGLSGTIVYRMNPPSQMNIIYNDNQEIVHDLETDGENLYVATGGNGRLYQVKPDFTRIAYFKSNQELILDVLMTDEGTPKAITTGEGAATYYPSSEKKDATYRSSPFDAHLLARWGKVLVNGTGQYALRTRTGNTPQPDKYWSDWSEWKSGHKITFPNPPSRYIQYEIKLLERSAHVDSVELSFQIPNQRPRIADLSISPNPVHKALINSTEGGESKNQQSPPQGKPPADSAFSLKRTMLTKRKIQWKAIDPDGDPVVSRVFYRPVESQKWISLTDEQYIPKNEYELNTRDLADGRYKIKVTATDKPFNDPAKSFTTSKITSAFIVDNTPPKYTEVTTDENKISFRAEDNVSRILLTQFRVNGDRWQALLPEDGIFDEVEEQFKVKLEESLESGDLLEIRVLDEGGNTSQIKRIIQ